MKPIEQLAVIFQMVPFADVRENGTVLFWETNRGRNRHSIRYIENEVDLCRAKIESRFDNSVSFAGNLKFVSTFE